jgi:hypothetical protein
MPVDTILDVRPRTTGEILDDAWRLGVAEGPRLFLLLGAFHVPAFCSILLVTSYASSVPPTWTDRALLLVLAASSATLLPLTGVGSGACQEYLRRRAENKPARLRDCLGAAWRRGIEHSAARAVLFAGVLSGMLFVLLPGCGLWMYGATIHALLSDDKVPPHQRWSQFGREASFDAGKAGIVVLSRLPLLVIAVVNLAVFAFILTWIAGNLAGFDVSMLWMQLNPAGNPAYLLSLFFLAWLLLAPFFEASNFLLYLDTRVRQEGLDLLYHVQRVFAAPERTKAAVGVLLALAVGLLLAAGPIYAAPSRNEARLAAVRTARQEVERITEEVRSADPSATGSRWEPRLRGVANRLETAWGAGADSFAWFRTALKDFGSFDRKKTLDALGDVQSRLSLLEDTLAPPADKAESLPSDRPKPSKDDVKNLLHKHNYEDAPAAQPDDPNKDTVKEVEVKHDGPNGSGGRPSGGVIAPSTSGAGLGEAGWMILLGLMVAVLAAGLVFLIVHLIRNRSRQPKPPKNETAALPDEGDPPPHEQPVAVLWQQAEKLAQEGRYLDALRMLYRAVLGLLHRRQLLRYESTRTNGEYVHEVRLSPQAPAELREQFAQLTDLFERKWYGDRVCEAAEFREGRKLADEIQGAVR